jgi:membrane protein required for colicin V production
MSVVDIAIIAIIVVSLVIGLFRGFIREVLSLASWIAALWIAYAYATFGASYLEPYIDQPPLRVVVAFAAIFIVVLIVASILSYLLYRLLSISGVTGVDRSLGLLFGVVRGVVIVAIFILLAIFMDMATQPWWQESLLVDYFSPITDMLRSLMPEDLVIYFEPKGGLG